MVITPPQVVQAPEPRGLRYGLFSAANGPYDLPTPHGIAGGVIYEPVSCGEAHTYPTICHPESVRFPGFGAQVGAAKTFDVQDEPIEADTYVVYASLKCGTAGTTPAILDTKVRRRLANGEQTMAEVGMATVLAAGATPILSPGTLFQDSIGELEEWLYGHATANYGNTGYLHAPYRMAAHAAFAQLIVRDGPLLRTPTGTIWVFGGGYDDDGTIFISGQVTVWRSADVFVSPIEAALNRDTNQYAMLAEREYAVAYDCVAASTTFDWGGGS